MLADRVPRFQPALGDGFRSEPAERVRCWDAGKMPSPHGRGTRVDAIEDGRWPSVALRCAWWLRSILSHTWRAPRAGAPAPKSCASGPLRCPRRAAHRLRELQCAYPGDLAQCRQHLRRHRHVGPPQRQDHEPSRGGASRRHAGAWIREREMLVIDGLQRQRSRRTRAALAVRPSVARQHRGDAAVPVLPGREVGRALDPRLTVT